MNVDPSSDIGSIDNKRQIDQKLLKRSLRRTVFEFFNKGTGWKITALVVDLKFLFWKLRHAGANFSDYYAGSIAVGLKRDRSHKTLGARKFLLGSFIFSPVELGQLENQFRGTNYFEVAIKYGLQSNHTCVDYGCGSLRVGQHLISYLQPDR